jgi:hypothetical protein
MSEDTRRGLLGTLLLGGAAAVALTPTTAVADETPNIDGGTEGGEPGSTIQLRRGTAAQWAGANPILASGETGVETDTGKHKLGDGNTDWAALPYFINEFDISVTYAAREQQQTEEAQANYLFRLSPATPEFAEFQIIQNSFPNLGDGDGTYNHTVHIGWNAARHGDSESEFTSGKPALYMGFEDNYFDHAQGQDYGSEWYISYASPDGTSVPVAVLRPFYCRVLDSDTNDPQKSVLVTNDIGQGPDGGFGVWGGVVNGRELLSLTQTEFNVHVPFGYLNVNGAITFNTTDDRVVAGILEALPVRSVGSYIGWVNYPGVQAGDLALIPRSNINGSVHIYAGAGTPTKVLSVRSDRLQVGDGPILTVDGKIRNGASEAVMDLGMHDWPIANPTTDPTDIGFETGGGIKFGSITMYPCTGAPPSDSVGANGDIAIRSDGDAGTTMYQRRAGAWVATAA